MTLLSLEESLHLDPRRAGRMYAEHLNPGLLEIYRALGLDDMDVKDAEGMEIRLADGRVILDFSGAMGVLALGHNHPRIIAAERFCHDQKVIDAIKMAPHKLQGALAYNLAQILPDPLSVSFFTVSGSASVEAAMKICEKAQGQERTKFITMTHAFHGKTHGALSVTTAGGFQRGFLMGVPRRHVIEVAFGDLDALEQAIHAHRKGRHNTIIALIVEPIQGEGILSPPDGYLGALHDLCRRHGILTIFDEVKSGMGRMGSFCAFQREDVVPDIVTLSKALGGGKRAIGAMVSSREVFQRAYGDRSDATLHTSTFSGLGGSCAVAIETLNVFEDERILQNTRERGAYLKRLLTALQRKHPSQILELKGYGLFQGVRFNLSGRFRLKDGPRRVCDTLDSVIMAGIVRALYEDYNILTHFVASAPDVLHVMPPLIVDNHHLDVLAQALDDILSRGFFRVAGRFLKDNLVDRVSHLRRR